MIQTKECISYFEKFLQEVKSSSNLALEFSSLCQKLRTLGIYVIPTKGKTPVARYETEEDKEKTNKKAITTEAAIVLPEWLAVIDIDCLEIFYTATGITMEELEQVTTIETGKGYHIYVLNDEKIPKVSSPVYGFEILKGQNEIVMLGGSRIYHEKLRRNICYNVIQPRVWTQEELIEVNPKFQRVFSLANSCSRKNGDRENQTPPPQFKGFKEVEIDFERLKEVLISYYHEGNRQNVVLYTAGFLAKSGVDMVDAIEFVSQLADENNDPEKKMRIAAVVKTYQKFEQGLSEEIKGIQGLIALGIPKEELLNCIREQEEQQQEKALLQENKLIEDKDIFESDEIYIYSVIMKKEDIAYDRIGPNVKFLYEVRDNEKTTYEIEWKGKTYILETIKDVDHISDITGIPIVNKSKYLKWITNQIVNLPVKNLITRTGWKGDTFYHPLLTYPDAEFSKEHVLIDPENPKAYISNKEKQHELILKALDEGKVLGFLYVASVCNILLKPINARPFTVFITGISAEGKTLSCTLACNIFYENPILTANATNVGIELTLKQLKDLPVLINEGALKTTLDLEKLVFMISEKLGKTRGTKKLGINITSLNSIVFYTSETSDIDEFKRTGAFRRIFHISISNWSEVTEIISMDDAKLALNLVGCGVDYISFVNNNKEIFSELKDFAEKYENIFPDMGQIIRGLFAGLKFFEIYYGTEFHNMFNYLMQTILAAKEIFDQKKDVVSEFIEQFYQYVVRNYPRFIDLKTVKDEPFRKPEIIGSLDYEDKIYIITTKFEEFCKQYGYDRKALLKLLKEKGILIADQNAYRVVHRIIPNTPPCSCYCLKIKDFNVRELTACVEVEEPF